jgi:chromosome segregation ATPase
MAIPSVIQGTVEVEGKVFELNSPKGAAWLETISSFRFEPSGDGKPCTVRREPSGYWYGCRKIAGKVRKKYIGKTSEVSTTRLEEIAEALEVPPIPRANEVAQVAQQVAEVAEVAEDRLTALEIQVANLRKALESLEEKLSGKPKLGDFVELPKADNSVTEELQNELSNLKIENKYLRQKLAESRDTIENLNWGTEGLNEQLKVAQTENQRLQNDLGNLQAEREELAHLKKQVKEDAAEVHREGNAIKVERMHWQRELSDARAELADAKATMLNQSNKIRELERGFSFKPNPAESKLRLEIGELRSELSDLKQKSAAASKDLPEAAEILNQLKAKRKKSKADLTDLEVILEILES